MKMTTLAERHFRFRFRHDRPARRLCIPCLSRGDIEGGRGSGMWSGWMGDRCPTALLFPCPTFWPDIGRCAPSYSALQQEMVVITRVSPVSSPVSPSINQSTWACLSLCSQQRETGLGSSPRARCSLRQDPRRLGPVPSRLAVSTSPPIGSRGWSVSILVSSRPTIPQSISSAHC